MSGELAGPDLNGGIGTTNRALALTLRDQGFDVEILYTRVDGGNPFSARGSFAEHIQAYRKLGIGLESIDNPGRWNDWPAKSYLALQHLLRRPYRLVFFDDTHGNAYYPLLARRTGNAQLNNTVMVVTAHSATQWISDLNKTRVSTIEELRQMEMERRSIELADAVKAPSAYILKKYRSYGWAVPENSIVLPNFLPNRRSTAQARRRVTIDELVFFGRLETRKGLWMFCRALDRLKYRLAGKRVTFLGKVTIEDGVSTGESLLRHSAGWPFEIRLVSNFDQEQALAYLKRPGRLAIIASPEDNSPSAILECLSDGIPFIACSGSGGEELLDARSRANLFEPTVDGLCAKLVEALERGATPGQPSFDEAQLQESFSSWIEGLSTSAVPTRASQAYRGEAAVPTLIVIVPPEISVREAAAELAQTVGAYRGRVNIEALTNTPSELRHRLMADDAGLPVRVSDFSEFSKVGLASATRESPAVALCHVTQIPPPEWLARAEACFVAEPEIYALTGMVAAANGRSDRRGDPPVTDHDGTPRVQRYLMGNARALLPLAQETNDGFVVLRSDVLTILTEIVPYDGRYGRLKRMAEWIHEILVTLHVCGKSFEVVPDLLADRPLREAPFEVFRLGHFLRALGPTMFDYAPGSEQGMLTQLAIDAGLDRERTLANAGYLTWISEKTGHRVDEIKLDVLSTEHSRQLAAIAHASGQIELASSLVANTAIKDGRLKYTPLSDIVRGEADAVSLVAETEAGRFNGLNLNESFSFRIEPDRRAITLHANPADKGLACIIYPTIDLSKVRRFTCVTSIRAEANPIRFRIELQSLDRSKRWSTSQVLQGGDESRWENDLPVDIRTRCWAMVGVEMANPADPTKGAFATLSDPRFVR